MREKKRMAGGTGEQMTGVPDAPTSVLYEIENDLDYRAQGPEEPAAHNLIQDELDERGVSTSMRHIPLSVEALADTCADFFQRGYSVRAAWRATLAENGLRPETPCPQPVQAVLAERFPENLRVAMVRRGAKYPGLNKVPDNPFDRNQYKIAWDTLQMNDPMAGVMGGPSKQEAVEIIERLSGMRVDTEGNVLASRQAKFRDATGTEQFEVGDTLVWTDDGTQQKVQRIDGQAVWLQGGNEPEYSPELYQKINEGKIRIAKRHRAGTSVTPTFRLEITDGSGGYTSPMEWDTAAYGRPSEQALEQWVMRYAESLEPGGANAHVSQSLGFVPYPTSAKVIRQETGDVVAQWSAPPFMVWSKRQRAMRREAPANVKDEGKWDEAKKAAEEQYGGPGGDVPEDRYWATVNSIYQNMGGEFTSESARRTGFNYGDRVVDDQGRTGKVIGDTGTPTTSVVWDDGTTEVIDVLRLSNASRRTAQDEFGYRGDIEIIEVRPEDDGTETVRYRVPGGENPDMVFGTERSVFEQMYGSVQASRRTAQVQPGDTVYWQDHGRVYVESVSGDTAEVRFDPGEGVRGTVQTAPASELVHTEGGWKPMANRRTALLDPSQVEIKKNPEHGEGYYDLYVNGNLQMEAESFPVVDQVRNSLIGIPGSVGETQEVADSILKGLGRRRTAEGVEQTFIGSDVPYEDGDRVMWRGKEWVVRYPLATNVYLEDPATGQQISSVDKAELTKVGQRRTAALPEEGEVYRAGDGTEYRVVEVSGFGPDYTAQLYSDATGDMQMVDYGDLTANWSKIGRKRTAAGLPQPGWEIWYDADSGYFDAETEEPLSDPQMAWTVKDVVGDQVHLSDGGVVDADWLWNHMTMNGMWFQDPSGNVVYASRRTAVSVQVGDEYRIDGEPVTVTDIKPFEWGNRVYFSNGESKPEEGLHDKSNIERIDPNQTSMFASRRTAQFKGGQFVKHKSGEHYGTVAFVNDITGEVEVEWSDRVRQTFLPEDAATDLTVIGYSEWADNAHIGQRRTAGLREEVLLAKDEGARHAESGMDPDPGFGTSQVYQWAYNTAYQNPSITDAEIVAAAEQQFGAGSGGMADQILGQRRADHFEHGEEVETVIGPGKIIDIDNEGEDNEQYVVEHESGEVSEMPPSAITGRRVAFDEGKIKRDDSGQFSSGGGGGGGGGGEESGESKPEDGGEGKRPEWADEADAKAQEELAKFTPQVEQALQKLKKNKNPAMVEKVFEELRNSQPQTGTEWGKAETGDFAHVLDDVLFEDADPVKALQKWLKAQGSRRTARPSPMIGDSVYHNGSWLGSIQDYIDQDPQDLDHFRVVVQTQDGEKSVWVRAVAHGEYETTSEPTTAFRRRAFDDEGFDWDAEDLEQGFEVEMEHADSVREDEDVANIAIDHLEEDPDYYGKLEQVEGLRRTAAMDINYLFNGLNVGDKVEFEGAKGGGQWMSGTVSDFEVRGNMPYMIVAPDFDPSSLIAIHPNDMMDGNVRTAGNLGTYTFHHPEQGDITITEGDRIEVGFVTGTITSINYQSVEITWDDGKTVTYMPFEVASDIASGHVKKIGSRRTAARPSSLSVGDPVWLQEVSPMRSEWGTVQSIDSEDDTGQMVTVQFENGNVEQHWYPHDWVDHTGLHHASQGPPKSAVPLFRARENLDGPSGMSPNPVDGARHIAQELDPEDEDLVEAMGSYWDEPGGGDYGQHDRASAVTWQGQA